MKTRRQQVILDVITREPVRSQEQLRRAVRAAGFDVTQATLSRDLRSLGVIRRPDADGGSVWELPGPAVETLDRGRQRLDLQQFVNDMRIAQNLLVVRTPPGHANAVGALYTALAAESPMVLLSGHAATWEFGRGGFQEIRQAEMAAPVCKASWTATSAATLGRDIGEAIRIATTSGVLACLDDTSRP